MHEHAAAVHLERLPIVDRHRGIVLQLQAALIEGRGRDAIVQFGHPVEAICRQFLLHQRRLRGCRDQRLDLRVRWLTLQRGIVSVECLLVTPQASESTGMAQVGLRPVGLEPDGVLRVVQRLLKLAERRVRTRPVRVVRRIRRVEADSLTVQDSRVGKLPVLERVVTLVFYTLGGLLRCGRHGRRRRCHWLCRRYGRWWCRRGCLVCLKRQAVVIIVLEGEAVVVVAAGIVLECKLVLAIALLTEQRLRQHVHMSILHAQLDHALAKHLLAHAVQERHLGDFLIFEGGLVLLE